MCWCEFSGLDCTLVASVVTYTYQESEGITDGGIYYIKNKNSGKYLDVEGAGTGNGTDVNQWPFTGAPNQQWKLTYQNNGTYKLQAMNTVSKLLQVASNSNSNGISININGSTTSDQQYWYIMQNPYPNNNSYRILSKCSNYSKGATVEGASMTNGANIFQYTYTIGDNDNDDWVFIVKSVENGEYLFQNADTEKYMQADNNGNSFMEQHEFSGSINQKWELIHNNDGYYKIKSVDSGLYLTAPNNLIDGEAIVQELYSGSTRQLWKITQLSNGSKRIASKSAESTSLVLSVGWGINWNGLNIEQRIYASDSNYRDEWELFDSKDGALLAIPEADGRDRSSFFPDVISSMQSFGYNDVFSKDGYSSISDCLAFLTKSKIFLIRTHGNTDLIVTSNGNLTRSKILSLPNNSLSNAELVYYGACLTGAGGEGGNNLVNATQSKGAQTVIGYSISVYCQETNVWAEAFFAALESGETVEQACYSADFVVSEQYEDSQITTNIWYIAGDESKIFN